LVAEFGLPLKVYRKDAREETATGVRRKNRADTSEKIDLDRYLDKPRHSTRKQTFVHENYVF
jgi:hypothetical protein